MSRKIIKIDSEKCIGCSLCAKTCQQSAIEMINGKAVVTSENYCDGIGNCLPVCPVNAISFSDKDVFIMNFNEKKKEGTPNFSACPSSINKSFEYKEDLNEKEANINSKLKQWPVQIKLISENAGYFNNANLLISADCAAYAYGNFHNDFMKNKVTIIGCPKLDMIDYTDKLTSIIKNNNIESVTVVRMEVPCCTGIETAAINAVKNSGKKILTKVVTLSIDGKILDR